ncbi:hypothetical protein CFC21_065520 [Triticum aestivum]|uniref:Uncharacterized protein n=2 Tax=Triticum aestivum TaxID=4565 RepID=A0A3B6KH96_WHEAT|nr:hypothetical protein CFC21_065520 [Triticum aestivum]
MPASPLPLAVAPPGRVSLNHQVPRAACALCSGLFCAESPRRSDFFTASHILYIQAGLQLQYGGSRLRHEPPLPTSHRVPVVLAAKAALASTPIRRLSKRTSPSRLSRVEPASPLLPVTTSSHHHRGLSRRVEPTWPALSHPASRPPQLWPRASDLSAALPPRCCGEPPSPSRFVSAENDVKPACPSHGLRSSHWVSALRSAHSRGSTSRRLSAAVASRLKYRRSTVCLCSSGRQATRLFFRSATVAAVYMVTRARVEASASYEACIRPTSISYEPLNGYQCNYLLLQHTRSRETKTHGQGYVLITLRPLCTGRQKYYVYTGWVATLSSVTAMIINFTVDKYQVKSIRMGLIYHCDLKDSYRFISRSNMESLKTTPRVVLRLRGYNDMTRELQVIGGMITRFRRTPPY